MYIYLQKSCILCEKCLAEQQKNQTECQIFAEDKQNLCLKLYAGLLYIF